MRVGRFPLRSMTVAGDKRKWSPSRSATTWWTVNAKFDTEFRPPPTNTSWSWSSGNSEPSLVGFIRDWTRRRSRKRLPDTMQTVGELLGEGRRDRRKRLTKPNPELESSELAPRGRRFESG